MEDPPRRQTSRLPNRVSANAVLDDDPSANYVLRRRKLRHHLASHFRPHIIEWTFEGSPLLACKLLQRFHKYGDRILQRRLGILLVGVPSGIHYNYAPNTS